ncbi:hypothetical protein BDV96DRAFT_92131 [Lophiotrema nucula]|uniref:Uncharacterized protein n=1 Tax=Lophiotrema nucula TaxID=690887 RepID=A0A6A5Z6Z4_9PLEO|nr:hypothetical protein BDV96DRAFT_92131 [Lophiotrema nucula]
MADDGFNYQNYGMNSKLKAQGTEPVYNIDNEMEGDAAAPAQKETLKIKDLVEEAAQGATTASTRKNLEVPDLSFPKPQKSDLYDSDAPLLSIVEDAIAMIYHAPTQGHRDQAIKSAEHNPLLLHHLITCAPDVVPPASKCKLCKHGRHCSVHEQAPEFYPPPSVSLCEHQRMVITLAANDPVNRNCSWKLEIKDYTDRDYVYAEEHKLCKPHRPNERVKLLAQRLMDDMHKRRMRGNERQAIGEIHALLGAWEYSKLIELEKIELAKYPQKLLAKQKRDEEITQLALHHAKKQVEADRKELERKLKAKGIPKDKVDAFRPGSYQHYSLDPRVHAPIKDNAGPERDPTEAEKTAAADKARLQLIDDLTAERIRDMKAAGIQMTAVDELGVKMDVLKELEAKKQGVAEKAQPKKRKISEAEEGEISESGSAQMTKKPRIEITAPIPDTTIASQSGSSTTVVEITKQVEVVADEAASTSSSESEDDTSSSGTTKSHTSEVKASSRSSLASTTSTSETEATEKHVSETSSQTSVADEAEKRTRSQSSAASGEQPAPSPPRARSRTRSLSKVPSTPSSSSSRGSSMKRTRGAKQVESASQSGGSKKVRFTPKDDVTPDLGRARRGSMQIPGSPYKGLLGGEKADIGTAKEDGEISEEE